MNQTSSHNAASSRSRTFSIWLLFAVGATVAAIFSYPYLPVKRQALIPGEVTQAIFAYVDETEQNAGVEWIDEANHHWRCFRHAAVIVQYCGYNLILTEQPGLGLDLSQYNRLELRVRYRGTAGGLRLFMRHYNPLYSNEEDGNTEKYMSVHIKASELEHRVVVDIDEFRVADWWLHQHDLPRHQARPESSNITLLGIGFDEGFPPGDHEVAIENLVLVGAWVSEKDWYLGILASWMLTIIAFAIRQWLALRNQTRRDRQRIDELASENVALTLLSNVDTLTEVLNRRGIEQAVHELLNQQGNDNLTLILLDIDNFKQLNDSHGHDAGDQVLKQMAARLMKNTRRNDRVGRWGGEEFLLMCPQTDIDSGYALAEKIRRTIAATDFTVNGLSINITASFGVSAIHRKGSFVTAFRQADHALYEAKKRGRNCSVIAT
jgi:diguanylate cyclase (GGDEF)-like protein